jgi:uncharacterized OB-fold protein
MPPAASSPNSAKGGSWGRYARSASAPWCLPDVCYVETAQWREVGTTGRIEAFTILATKFGGLPDPPTVIGYVTLDGASTAILNYVEGLPLDDLDAAAKQLLGQPRVRVRFHPQPEGRITDFHFEVTDEPA